MAEQTCITEPELRAAFQRSGLWRRGWTFQRALNNRCVLLAMLGTVRATRDRIERNTGKPAPAQQALI